MCSCAVALDDPRRTMTTKEVGEELLHKAPKTVRKYIKEKGLPAIDLDGEYLLIRGSVEDWLRERER